MKIKRVHGFLIWGIFLFCITMFLDLQSVFSENGTRGFEYWRNKIDESMQDRNRRILLGWLGEISQQNEIDELLKLANDGPYKFYGPSPYNKRKFGELLFSVFNEDSMQILQEIFGISQSESEILLTDIFRLISDVYGRDREIINLSLLKRALLGAQQWKWESSQASKSVQALLFTIDTRLGSHTAYSIMTALKRHEEIIESIGDELPKRRAWIFIEGPDFYPKADVLVRVGGPFFNYHRNKARNRIDAGEKLNDFQRAVLNIEEKRGVYPGTPLIFSQEIDEEGQPHLVIYEALYDKSIGGRIFTGQIEAQWDNQGSYLFLDLWAPGILFSEIVNAVESDSIGKRYRNSGLAIWDASTGIVYSGIDVFRHLYDLDVTRAESAGARIFHNGVQLGITVLGKTLRFPIDLVMSAINGSGSLTFDGENDEEGDRKLMQHVIDDNDYDFDLTLDGMVVVGEATFREDNKGSISLNTGEKFDFDWISVHTPSIELFTARFTYDGKSYVCVGEIDGLFDIDIEGVILPEKDFERLQFENQLSLQEIKDSVIGKFRFDD